MVFIFKKKSPLYCIKMNEIFYQIPCCYMHIDSSCLSASASCTLKMCNAKLALNKNNLKKAQHYNYIFKAHREKVFLYYDLKIDTEIIDTAFFETYLKTNKIFNQLIYDYISTDMNKAAFYFKFFAFVKNMKNALTTNNIS